MKFSVQTDDFDMLKESVESECNCIRFGPEFCEIKIPKRDTLKKAYNLVVEKGKEFTYITPFVSNTGLNKIQKQFAFLNNMGKIDVVINDLGIFKILRNYPNLRPHLGRQLVFIPARCPWPQITEKNIGFFARKQVAKIFYQTNLNYLPTIRFYQKHGVRSIDIDWIPKCFPHFAFLAKNGLDLSVHTHLIPVAITRRCYTARFLKEEKLESCTKPCNKKSFHMKHELLDDLFLNGNVIFRLIEPSKRALKSLSEKGLTELVIPITPLTKIHTQTQINTIIEDMEN